jgi:hypothetical protein
MKYYSEANEYWDNKAVNAYMNDANVGTSIKERQQLLVTTTTMETSKKH